MAVDPLSPIAPARIRALLLPVGRIKRSCFLTYVDLLQQQSLIRLGDVSPDPRPDRNMFSPLAFPRGTLLYDLSPSLPPASQISLSPFEQFREPLLVIGVGDASEYAWLEPSCMQDGNSGTVFDESFTKDEGANQIHSVVEDLREQFPRAYLHSFMMFQSVSQHRHPYLPQETFLIPLMSHLKTTTIKTVMCDLTATLLAEMTTLAKSIQALPTVASPASQNGMTYNTPSWASADHSLPYLPKRNSQTPSATKSESQALRGQKDLQRMSMPVLSSNTGGLSTAEETKVPTSGNHEDQTSPTIFDETSSISAVNTKNQINNNTLKQGGPSIESTTDRISIHGFGSGGVGERARNKGRGRVSVVIGTLYMCAGQWHDAVRELSEGATRARALSDHLWHAKALEHIMVCLLLYAWSGMDFQIPQICYPVSDRSASTKHSQNTPTNSATDVSVQKNTSSHAVALEALNSLLPDLVNMILNLYTRASNFAGESLPPLPFSECVIRFSKLLTAMNLAAGYLDEEALQNLVRNTLHEQKSNMSIPRPSIYPTRHEICAMLFRALPGPVESSGMTPTDRVLVLANIASVLSSLDMQRKKAIVMMEFISSLIPGLVQARKVGAAELGVHPAAGLVALNMISNGPGAGSFNLGDGEIENGIDKFLRALGRIYGIPSSEGMPSCCSNTTDAVNLTHDNSRRAMMENIIRTSSLRAIGCLDLKLEILRLCNNFCEALPDFNGMLYFTALLLRVAGPGTAPKPNSTNVHVSLPRDEQARLYNNILRTMAASTKLGLHIMETEYWDDFLIRGLYIADESSALRLIHHRPAELKSTTPGRGGPFLYNPWLKKQQEGAVDAIMVSNQCYHFIITLQNPYDFELEIESLKIATEGVELTGLEERVHLGPYRTQKFQISGTPRSSGTLKIVGCFVKLVACRECLFPIFTEPWEPRREPRLKNTGLQAHSEVANSRVSSVHPASVEKKVISEPRPDISNFTVIPDQPVLVVTGTTLPQHAIMVLEGERKRFTITVRNTSTTTAVDFVHISFQDSATTTVQAALTDKDLPAAELHEVEVQLAYYPSLRWCRASDERSTRIQSGEEMEFVIEVFGRVRLADAIIQINYANLGKRQSEIEDQFYTRQVSVPISITVNPSMQLQRHDIIPLSGDFTSSVQQDQIVHAPAIAAENSSDYDGCLLLLDFRNSWSNPLAVCLQVRRPSTAKNDQLTSWDEALTIREIIQPGHVSRIVLVIPRIHQKNPQAAIPSLNPANQRQFIVSTSKISPEMERQNREAFWYRHELLDLIQGTWTEESTGRHGSLELRGIRLSPRMVEAFKLEDVDISLTLASSDQNLLIDNKVSAQQLSRTKFAVPIDEFFTLRTRVMNRSAHTISSILRIQPHLADLPYTIALDLDKRFSWSGVLQRKLPAVAPGGTVESELGIVALCAGIFAIDATVDELEIAGEDAESEALQNDGRAGRGHPDENAGGRTAGKTRHHRSATQVLRQFQHGVLGPPKLRSWHARESCLIVAKHPTDLPVGEENNSINDNGDNNNNNNNIGITG